MTLRHYSRTRLIILSTLIVLMMGVVAPVLPLRTPSGPLRVSYNPYPASDFHAPLSSIGVVMVENMATPLILPTPQVVVVPPPQRLSGDSTIRQNSLRFINDTSYFPQSETSVGVDPSNTNHVVGGFNDAKFFLCGELSADCAGSLVPSSLSGFSVSIDGGKTLLKSGDLPSVLGLFRRLSPFGDPSVAPSTDGNFFYSSIAFEPGGRNGIVIAKSNSNLFDPAVSCITSQTDPTVNPCWNTAFVFGVITFPFASAIEDKDLLVVDRNPQSPYYGSVYIAWDHFYRSGVSQSYLSRCDGNLTSCTMLAGGDLPYLSAPDLFASFTTPAVDRNGNVYVTWCNYGTYGTFGPVYCRIRSSPPGGTNFGPTSNIVSYMGQGTTLPNATVTIGWATEQFRTFSIPNLAADTSSKTNNLYFTTQVCISGFYYAISSLFNPFVAQDNPGNCGASAVVFLRSTDGGTTWTSPVTLSKPAVNEQPFVTVDAFTGNVYVLYYTTQYDPFNHRIDVVALKSMDGGVRWRQTRITSVSNEPNSDPNMYLYYSSDGGSITVPQYGDYFQGTDVAGKLWVMFTGNYAVEAGTFQTDPFLAVAII